MRHGLDGNQALGPALAVPAAANQAVDADHLVAGSRQVEGGCPAEVAVHPQHDDRLLPHGPTGMLPRRIEIVMRAPGRPGAGTGLSARYMSQMGDAGLST